MSAQYIFRRRFYIAILWTCAYIRTVWTLIVPQEALFSGLQWFLEAIPATLALSWMLVLLSIELSSKHTRRIAKATIAVIWTILAITVRATWIQSWYWLSIVTLVLHGWMIAFLNAKRSIASAKINNSLWSIAFGAIWLRWATIWIIYSLNFWMQFAESKLECTAVYEEFESLTSSPIWPLKRLSQRIVDPEDVRSTISTSQASQKWLLWQLWNEFYINGIQKATSTRTMLRDNICTMLTTQLQSKAQNGRWVLWVVLIVFVILAPLLSFVYRIASVLLRWIIWVLIKTEVYTWTPKMIETRQLQ